MSTIHKYELKPNDDAPIKMPTGSQVLCVQVQHNKPYIWALVDTTFPMQDRYFKVYGTGWDIIGWPVRAYVGSFQLDGGLLVFHVFEDRR